LAPVRPLLPRHGRIGFIADPAADPGTQVRQYYLSQYVLAPLVVVVEETNPPCILAIWEPGLKPDQTLAGRRKLLIHDTERGVALWKAE
jgi:hypothetical protein